MINADEAKVIKMYQRIMEDGLKLEKERSLQIQKLICSYAKVMSEHTSQMLDVFQTQAMADLQFDNAPIRDEQEQALQLNIENMPGSFQPPAEI